MKSFRTLSRKTILDRGRFLLVEEHEIELPDGRRIPDWTWIVTPDFVNVIPITDEGDVLCFRQTKYAVEGVSLAPVGGFIDPGEDPLTAAKRELLEETGYEAEDWTSLGSYAVDGNRGCGSGHFFVARGAREGAAPDADDLEEMELVHLSPRSIREAIARGEVKCLPWVAALSLALNALE